MNFYIATKLENHREHNRLRDILIAAGHSITYDWTEHGPVYTHGLKRVAEVADLEIKGVRDADVVIVLWPGGRGTHVELGAAIAGNKFIVLVSEVEGHHIASPETCAFYHHNLVFRCRNISEVLSTIQGNGCPEYVYCRDRFCMDCGT